MQKGDGWVQIALCETRPLRTFDFGKGAIKVCKYDGKVTFTIPFQDIYLFIKGDLAQHQERSCKGDLSITLMGCTHKATVTLGL